MKMSFRALEPLLATTNFCVLYLQPREFCFEERNHQIFARQVFFVVYIKMQNSNAANKVQLVMVQHDFCTMIFDARFTVALPEPYLAGWGGNQVCDGFVFFFLFCYFDCSNL